MWANRKYPRTPCIIVTIEESISPQSPRWRMYSSTWARLIPISGSSPLPSHQANQRASCEVYISWVRPE